MLPPDLHIVPRGRWERVQAQIHRNRSFSPRNEKHKYLLKGLVRCGACGRAYAGSASHGRFFYRCSVQCKGMPIIAEVKLDEAIKAAVTKVMLDPNLILEPLRTLHRNTAAQRIEQSSIAERSKREEKRLSAEEHRILDAYRMNLLSPRQLGDQLEKLRSQRALLSLEQPEAVPQAVAFEESQMAVEDYCAAARASLARFDVDSWREFLRTVIVKTTFCGDHVKIQGRIPMPVEGDISFAQAGVINKHGPNPQ